MFRVVLLACLIALATCQLTLVNPAGRGYDFHDSRHGPCGTSADIGTRVVWEEDSVVEIEVQILGAAGGGVIVDRYSCVRNGDAEDPMEPILPIKGALAVQVPDFDDQIYRLNIKTPSFRCAGDATLQLIYSTQNGHEFFQCQDIFLTYSSASTLSMSVFAVLAVVLMVL